MDSPHYSQDAEQPSSTTDAPNPEPDQPMKVAEEDTSCWVCGGPVIERHCKIVCQVCGFTRDCSDP